MGIDPASRLAIIDVTDPVKPKLISNEPFDYRFYRYSAYLDDQVTEDGKLIVKLPQLPGMPDRERLKLAAHFANVALDSDLLCINNKFRTVVAFRLTALTESLATFDRIGESQSSVLQRVFGSSGQYSIQLKDGLLYQIQVQPANINADNAWLCVFDVAGPHPMKMIGHFAAPGASVVCPLPDGRVLVGGRKLWVLGPPARR